MTASQELVEPFERQAFEQRVSAHLKNDLDRNGRITPDGIAMIGAEAEFYANRASLPTTAQAADQWRDYAAIERLLDMSDKDIEIVKYMLLEKRRSDPKLDARCRRVSKMIADLPAPPVGEGNDGTC